MDKRRFDREGNPRDEAEVPVKDPPSSSGRESGGREEKRPEIGGRSPAIEFSEFILSIGTNAAILLGGDDMDRVPGRADLASASQHIDIIAMLREKTRGNLDEEEVKLVDSLLYDLQMRYLEVAGEQRR